MTTWNELKQDERACLFNIATSDKAVGGWIWTGDIPHFVRSALDSLIAHGLIEERITSPHRICYVKITPAGFTVYQQGQMPDEPDELTRLREQVEALTAERDALKAESEDKWLEAHEVGFNKGIDSGVNALIDQIIPAIKYGFPTPTDALASIIRKYRPDYK